MSSPEDLAKLLPPGDGRVVNYGQGEGQFEVAETTWGFYCAPAPILVFEEGQCTLEEVLRIGALIVRQLNLHWGPNIEAKVIGALDDVALASREYPSHDAI